MACFTRGNERAVVDLDPHSFRIRTTYINPGSANGVFNLWAAEDRVYLRARSPAHGIELWVSDLTTTGTKLVKDINPGVVQGFDSYATVVGNRLYFAASTIGGQVLYVSDGTDSGTHSVCDLETQNPTFVTLQGRLYVSAFDLGGAGLELIEIVDPGAMVETFESRCAPDFSFMTATPPVLGASSLLRGETPPNHVGLVLIAAPDTPSLNLPILQPQCRSRTFAPLLSLTATPSGSWSIPLAVPNVAALRGVSLFVQTWNLQAVSLFPASTTNALRLTVGR
ncbi:MAG: hypothetical protein H6832_10370 [Planctomycetes bacterium]|nr:hypothetical protein [Planctomycetota bacterium]